MLALCHHLLPTHTGTSSLGSAVPLCAGVLETHSPLQARAVRGLRDTVCGNVQSLPDRGRTLPSVPAASLWLYSAICVGTEHPSPAGPGAPLLRSVCSNLSL